MNGSKYLCPVCNKHYFREIGTHEICPICDWINDSVQNTDPNYTGGENKLSLNEYRKKWHDDK